MQSYFDFIHSTATATYNVHGPQGETEGPIGVYRFVLASHLVIDLGSGLHVNIKVGPDLWLRNSHCGRKMCEVFRHLNWQNFSCISGVRRRMLGHKVHYSGTELIPGGLT